MPGSPTSADISQSRKIVKLSRKPDFAQYCTASVIRDIYLNPVYWLLFAGVMALGRLAIGYRILDFKFILWVYLSQYIAHVTLAFGLSQYLIFCVLFLTAFILGYRGFQNLPNLVLYRTAARDDVERRLVLICKVILLTFYSWRLSSVPIWTGAFDLAARLALQNESRAGFFLGLVMLPLFVGFLYDCVRKGRFGWADWSLIVISALGALTNGSKITILPLILSYIGVGTYLGRRISLSPLLVVSAAVAGAVMVFTLSNFFPTLSSGEILDLLLYRIVANTDNIEYLYTLDVTPDQYPFAGAVSFIPFLSKYLGAQIDFPYGVWLHGMRYAEWAGYGPNAGFLIEQYGNLGWGGLVVGLGLGTLVRWTERVRTAFRAMILSFSYTLLVESTMFFMSLFFCLLILVVAFAMHKLWRPGLADDELVEGIRPDASAV
jgi:hypothetical protein